MALYFLVLDSSVFHEEIRPALASSWRCRSFAPCRPYCTKLLPAAQQFSQTYHVGGEPLLAQVDSGLPFDRVLWQHLAGEMLWFSAAEIPELETNADALACLLAPNTTALVPALRGQLPPILQVHQGSRDLVFGGGFYRPENAGWNDIQDVQRLAAYLQAVQPEAWQPADLAGLPLLPEEERAEELAYARDWFAPLQSLYADAAARRQVIVCELLE